MPAPTRLDALHIGEVSGVDHPAHLVEGWNVLKSLTGLSDDEMAEVMASAQAEAAAEIAKSNPPSKEHVVTDTVTPADSTEDFVKSLPEPVRKAYQEMQATAQSALSELQKARDLNADREAVAKAATDFAHIPGLDPEVFGPLFRKAAEKAPEEVAEIAKALGAADAALKESNLMKEYGSSVSPSYSGGSSVTGSATSAYAEISAMAKSYLADGSVTSEAAGIAKALTEKPSLYEAYSRQKMEQ